MSLIVWIKKSSDGVCFMKENRMLDSFELCNRGKYERALRRERVPTEQLSE
jgi:hypothetical protein